jgi:GNAT superfamily N-acetyltransferase
MKIRKIQESDLLTCSVLLENVYSLPPYGEIFKENTAQAYILGKYNNCKDSSFVSIDDNENVIAFAFFNISSWSEGLQAVLEEVVVDPNLQNKGIGKELLNYGYKYLNSLGVKSIMIWVKSDKRLLNFYEKQGYFLADDFVVMFKNF